MSRIRRAAAVAATLALLATPLLAANNPAADSLAQRDLQMVKPEDVGMSSDGLAKITAAAKEYVDEGKLSSAVTMVARRGKLVHYEAYGNLNIEKGTPASKDSIYRIYSMTKPIAGVALMILYDEGKFQLDDPVSKYIPEFKDLQVAKEDGPDGMPVTEPADHEMTIRELVSHTGGLTYGFFSRSQTDSLYAKVGILDRNQTIEDMTKKLGKLPLRQQPGSIWHYSVSVDVQGYLVEVLSGQKFDAFLEKRIFGPLGMTDTAFWVPEDKVSRFSHLYVPDKDNVLQAQPFGEYLENPAFLSGGGGLVGTGMDYMRFAQMLANGGELDGTRILKPETVKLMHTNMLPDHIDQISPMFAGNKFGVQFAIVDNPSERTDHALAKGEYWWFGIGGTFFGINPVQDLIVVGMIQNRGGMASNMFRFLTKRLAYEAILDPVAE